MGLNISVINVMLDLRVSLQTSDQLMLLIYLSLQINIRYYYLETDTDRLSCNLIGRITRYGPPFSTFAENRTFFKFPLFLHQKFSKFD